MNPPSESDESFETFVEWKRKAKEESVNDDVIPLENVVPPEATRSEPVAMEEVMQPSPTNGDAPGAESSLRDATRDAENVTSLIDETEYGVPADISYWKLFVIFLGFGIRGWGAPTIKIDMMRQELCVEQKWLAPEKFFRVYGIYQILPGPEATEMACYFGLLARGRIGSVISGLGFILPGFALMLFLSWITFDYGSVSPWFQACMQGVVPATVALVFRGTEKIAQHFLLADNDKPSKKPILERWYNIWLFVMVIFGCVQSVLRINFFITIGVSGVLGFLAFSDFPCFKAIRNERIRFVLRLTPPVTWMLLCVGMFILYCLLNGGLPSSSNILVAVGSEPTYSGLFVLGLLTGLLTFGGAATALPFVFSAAVVNGQWLTEQQFLTAIALGSVIPAPLVMFVTYVGFVGARWGGAVLMTLGVFLPAFLFTLVLHEVIDRLFRFKSVIHFVDGITASVVGLLALTAFGLMKKALIDFYTTALLVMSLQASYYFNHKLLVPMIVITALFAGLVAYAPQG